MFINLTPHAVNVIDPALTVPASGTIARVEQTINQSGTLGGVPLFEVSFGEVIGLPKETSDTVFIVSGMVLEALQGSRGDVVAPAELVRDHDGRVIGCRGFRR